MKHNPIEVPDEVIIQNKNHVPQNKTQDKKKKKSGSDIAEGNKEK